MYVQYIYVYAFIYVCVCLYIQQQFIDAVKTVTLYITLNGVTFFFNCKLPF